MREVLVLGLNWVLGFGGGVRRRRGGSGGRDAQKPNQRQVHHRVLHPTTGTGMEADDSPQERTRVLEVVLTQREVRREG